MRAGLAIVVLAASVVVVASVVLVPRLRPPSRIADVLSAISGAGLALGALVPQHGVETAEWIVAPLVLAALLPVHLRLLFAGDGFLRV
jgi:hypothetical protein